MPASLWTAVGGQRLSGGQSSQPRGRQAPPGSRGTELGRNPHALGPWMDLFTDLTRVLCLFRLVSSKPEPVQSPGGRLWRPISCWSRSLCILLNAPKSTVWCSKFSRPGRHLLRRHSAQLYLSFPSCMCAVKVICTEAIIMTDFPEFTVKFPNIVFTYD